MHPSPTEAPSTLPAFVLALALLGALTAGGWQAWVQMRMAPSTVLQAGAEAAVARPNNARADLSAVNMPPATESGPGWGTLNTAQKLALYPLAERWALISEAQKRRWLDLATNYPNLSEEEQRKFHDRITDWASLSAQQRNQARLNYAVTKRRPCARFHPRSWCRCQRPPRPALTGRMPPRFHRSYTIRPALQRPYLRQQPLLPRHPQRQRPLQPGWKRPPWRSPARCLLRSPLWVAAARKAPARQRLPR